MMRSMFSGVSGLRVHQTKMDVIANNISNVNTTGFKSSRVTFSEIFAQTVSGASASNDTTGRGGVNPMQIGLGANVASIDLSMTTGAAQRTDNPYDLMIQGEGFFIVGDNSGQYFTRAGAFNLDEAGNLVNASGLKVYGWDREKDKNGIWTVRKGAVQPITISGEKRYSPPSATTKVKFADNLNAVTDSAHTSTIEFFDTLGNRWVTTVDFKLKDPSVTNGTTVWTYTVNPSAYMDSDPSKKYTLALTGAPTGDIAFDVNGNISSVSTAAAAGTFDVVLNVKPPSGTGATAPPVAIKFGDASENITIDFSGLTQFGEQTTNAKSERVNGYGPGTLNGVNIGTDGKVTGRYSNGEMAFLAQIAVARFRNAAGLEKIGDNLYAPTPNSGEFDGVGEEVQASGGKIMGGVLEMSNVDLSQEFTEMITTQRGFQANSRIITVSDDMLQELVNLKR